MDSWEWYAAVLPGYGDCVFEAIVGEETRIRNLAIVVMRPDGAIVFQRALVDAAGMINGDGKMFDKNGIVFTVATDEVRNKMIEFWKNVKQPMVTNKIILPTNGQTQAINKNRLKLLE